MVSPKVHARSLEFPEKTGEHNVVGIHVRKYYINLIPEFPYISKESNDIFHATLPSLLPERVHVHV
jgi:hypothetical protein